MEQNDLTQTNSITQPVIRGVSYMLAHAPGLVRHGYKPSVDIARIPSLLDDISSHLRSYEDAVRYPPNQAFLGNIYPDKLREIERPWFEYSGTADRRQRHGEIVPEEELFGMMKICDAFDLMWLEEGFVNRLRATLAVHPLFNESDLEKLGEGQPASAIEDRTSNGEGAMPLYIRDGSLIGSVRRAHETNAVLGADVVMENLAVKATATLALRNLLLDDSFSPDSIDYVLNTGEEAVGDPYQRGGGNLAKAIGEMCGLNNATGADVKAFCCAPIHALIMAGALVSAGVYKQVAVVGGCSLPKLGMNFQGHLEKDQPIIEDVLASVAVIVGQDDGVSPKIWLNSVGKHNIGAGSSLRAISRTLVTEPLTNAGLKFQDIDKYAIELQNPEITEPAGIGDVTERNYKLIAALAVQSHEIERSDIARFSEVHGMPGFSSTQGHIASAVPFLGHARDQLVDGDMQRAMFIAKGSLFLGRMTQMSDGVSVILTRNNGV